MALTVLTESLRPFVESQLKGAFGDQWLDAARSSFRGDHSSDDLPDDIELWDAHSLLTVMWDQWNSAFRRRLGLFERSLVAELRAFRNRWAHQRSFDFDDTYRLLDSVQRLLSKIPGTESGRISVLKFELLRDEFGETINAAARERENMVERWVVSFVYLICGAIFVYLIPVTFREVMVRELIWGLTAAVAAGFLFLIYKRIKHRPVEVGPHECRRCRRIIYGTSCPYCSKPVMTFDATEYRISSDDDSVESPVPGRPARHSVDARS